MWLIYTNQNVVLLNIVDSYYEEIVKCLESKGEDQHSQQEIDQEESVLDGHSKNSIPDTPSLNIQDSQFEEIVKTYIETCSKATNPTIDTSGSDQLPVQVASGEEYVIIRRNNE